MTVELSYALVSKKPGVGKTTTAVGMAFEFHRRGFNPLVVEGDPAGSLLAWSDAAAENEEVGAFPFGVIQLGDNMHREIPRYTADVDVVIIDAGQMEDHAKRARSAMKYANTWIAPLAPSGLEVNRTGGLDDDWEDVQDLRGERADSVVLLNRTNRAQATASGSDAALRGLLVSQGYRVLDTQIQHRDEFRRCFGRHFATEGNEYENLVTELLVRAGKQVAA